MHKMETRLLLQYLTMEMSIKNPQVEVTEILGAKNEPGTDVLSIVRSYGIPEEFPQEVLDSLDLIPEEVTEAEKIGRRDMRDFHTVTIDGEDARDLDDAISLTFEMVLSSWCAYR